jgi:hypothetical protein
MLLSRPAASPGLGSITRTGGTWVGFSGWYKRMEPLVSSVIRRVIVGMECSNRLPYLGVTMQETTPLITERPLDPGQTTEQATPSFHLPDELWVHILRRVCSLTLGEKVDSRAVLQMRALTHATRAAFGAVFAQAYAAASLSKRRRFVIDVLAGATVETPFTYSGERSSPPSCLAAADRSLSHAGRIGKGIARHRGLGPSRALHQRHIAVGHG